MDRCCCWSPDICPHLSPLSPSAEVVVPSLTSLSSCLFSITRALVCWYRSCSCSRTTFRCVSWWSQMLARCWGGGYLLESGPNAAVLLDQRLQLLADVLLSAAHLLHSFTEVLLQPGQEALGHTHTHGCVNPPGHTPLDPPSTPWSPLSGSRLPGCAGASAPGGSSTAAEQHTFSVSGHSGVPERGLRLDLVVGPGGDSELRQDALHLQVPLSCVSC